ncbi:hypothetical protein BRADI_3g28455v3 [Brachypodium distachyon]|uniref:Uncharacterized protein n=1 Tax=Brachypodium distachyon TaxID=15368 RepID=A0A2K2CZR0_BRADI|nr:hypothetical protein BRADI_3g28455v3 [Brachypodium distachyon]
MVHWDHSGVRPSVRPCPPHPPPPPSTCGQNFPKLGHFRWIYWQTKLHSNTHHPTVPRTRSPSYRVLGTPIAGVVE